MRGLRAAMVSRAVTPLQRSAPVSPARPQPSAAAGQRGSNPTWQALVMRTPQGDSSLPHALAARSAPGGPLPDAVRAEAEARTGVDLRSVRVHDDVAGRGVAASLSSPAATSGTDVYVGRASHGVLLHEAVHAAQALSGGPVASSHAVEAEARSVAEGGSRSSGDRFRAAPAEGTFSRYEGPEHQDIGMAGWQARIPLPNYPRGLTYGEIVSLAGDIFGSYEQLVKAPAQEIDRVLLIMEQQRQKYMEGHAKAVKEGKTEEEAIHAGGEAGYHGLGWGNAFNRATGGRYLALAAGQENLWHFSDKNKNIDRYRMEHQAAIAAAQAGRKEEARARDGFASHYLTDRFSAGHLRASVDAAPLERKRQHDHDNTHGLNVVNERGDAWKMYGDGHLHDPRNAMNLHLAREAVRASQDDIERAERGEAVPMFPSARTGRPEFQAMKIVPWMGANNEPLPARTAGQAVGQGAQGFVKGLLDVPIVGGIIKGVANTVDWASEDDRAREQIAGGQAGRLPVQQRVVLIRQLLSGSCGDEDEAAIIRLFRESTADEMVQMADAVDIETLYSKIDGEELDIFIRTVKPMFRRWTEARKIQHLSKRFKGWTKGWEEDVSLSVLEACEAGELQRIVDHFGVSRLRSELGDHKARLNALLSRAGRS